MFGPWIHHLDELRSEFQKNQPFEHVVIENFFEESYAQELHDAFPRLRDTKWFHYNNPIEQKYATNDFSQLPIFQKLFERLQSSETLDPIQTLTGIKSLEADPHLHGGGLHFHPRGGKLDMHLDYSIHPLTNKERRVNLIVYMTKGWKEEWNGDNQLWDEEFQRPVKRIFPAFNRAILFRTSDLSYHGMPAPMLCPEDTGRKSIAIYYVSEPRPDATHRFKAQFRALPWQPIDERLQKLYDIRVTRTLTPEDLETHYPGWETDGKGFW
jgi:Rps23 Pro-64 3,4-dihydroxylase Tpa1-like proline 4-hydroxylase